MDVWGLTGMNLCSVIPSTGCSCSAETVRGTAPCRLPHQRRPTTSPANGFDRDQDQGRWLLEGMLESGVTKARFEPLRCADGFLIDAVVLLCAAAVSWMPASRDRLDRHGWILLHSHYHPFVYLLHLQVFDAENVIFHRVHSLFDIILDLYAENVIFASFNLNTDPELACL
ncbi:hypothetical protein SAY86_029149 [Trapa natans]|uniref:Uncharacterized protein n=1 Tax=Trapa natans TaxID=22666 RepID=A0AAN7MKJ2_TRANT|nr:hypothetical protein SAY86_029149 [Trapa natans]